VKNRRFGFGSFISIIIIIKNGGYISNRFSVFLKTPVIRLKNHPNNWRGFTAICDIRIPHK
jgi:hypothetical protein